MPRFVMQCMTPLLVLLSKTDNRIAFENYSAEAQKWILRLPPESNEVTGYHEVLAETYARQKQYAKSNDHYRRLLQLHKVNAHAPLTKLHLYMAHNYSHM